MPQQKDPPQQSLGPDAGTLDPTDGREKLQWESGYSEDARSEIRFEAWYVLIMLALAISLIFATWMDVFTHFFSLTGNSAVTLKKYCYYSFSGLLGGTIFGMKYMYRVVARGYWHQDRRLWRLQSPFVAFGVSFAFATLIEGRFMPVGSHTSGAAIVGLGFLIGYFADDATGKLHEIASILFGKSSAQTKSPPTDSK